jgi:hypothetical protein
MRASYIILRELYITEAEAKRGACCASKVFDAKQRFIWNQDVMTSTLCLAARVWAVT